MTQQQQMISFSTEKELVRCIILEVYEKSSQSTDTSKQITILKVRAVLASDGLLSSIVPIVKIIRISRWQRRISCQIEDLSLSIADTSTLSKQ